MNKKQQSNVPFLFHAANATKRMIKIGFIVLIVVIVFFSFLFFIPNTYTNKNFYYIEIQKDSKNIDSIYQQLQSKQIIKYGFPFLCLSKLIRLSSHLQTGRYEIEAGASTFSIISTLYYGEQKSIKIIINGGRKVGDVVSVLKTKFPIDSIQFVKTFIATVQELDSTIKPSQILTILIPNTYEFYWTTGYKDIIKKWYKYYQKFWSPERRKLAQLKGLTPTSAYILASIVEQESNLESEKYLISSVYLNRLKGHMYLGSCPTVIYALDNFSLRRLYDKDLRILSPYNTYIHKGLPPGPICLPSEKTIDIVLHAPTTKYLYFVANSDSAGHHIYSTNAYEHQRAAHKYQQFLNDRDIIR